MKTIQTHELSAAQRAELFLDDLSQITGATLERAFATMDLDALGRAKALETVSINLRAAFEDLGE